MGTGTQCLIFDTGPAMSQSVENKTQRLQYVGPDEAVHHKVISGLARTLSSRAHRQ
ncbi:hypothetical protein SBA5_550049 [Candidatus Sulfotelmatomonas gaucii]|uniref:Uncharacterized protein n=1 Tax=Candidatus Sulfuritelmatomonas gaucii TaxID=2043161 RepID=A0A2N9LTR8_9BACT|nr:hypothetical protein SBA5_550049 [Candidatus Sulfotelmatomonas gaucii]